MKAITTETIEALAAIEKEKLKPENPNRRVILDRRAKNSDRRVNMTDHDYQGPYRRNTVDQRASTKDRRKD